MSYVRFKYVVRDSRDIGSKYRVYRIDPRNPSCQELIVVIAQEGHAHAVADALNNSISDFLELNNLPNENIQIIARKGEDPNDPDEELVACDRLSAWLNASERLADLWKGALIDKISEIKCMILNVANNGKRYTVRQDMGNWVVYRNE